MQKKKYNYEITDQRNYFLRFFVHASLDPSYVATRKRLSASKLPATTNPPCPTRSRYDDRLDNEYS